MSNPTLSSGALEVVSFLELITYEIKINRNVLFHISMYSYIKYSIYWLYCSLNYVDLYNLNKGHTCPLFWGQS